jgi:4-hydroxy-3-polyprenylbenzoate decarboxylase
MSPNPSEPVLNVDEGPVLSEVEGSTPQKRRLVIGITGASGVILGIRTLELLRQVDDIETHLVLSPAAKITIAQETHWKVSQVLELAGVVHPYQDIGASIASGSFQTMGMLVVPCSIKTLSAIANSLAADLLSRAADVTLKEGRPLLLVVRETPLHRGHIRLMDLAAQAGAVIFPPVPAFYARPQTMEDMVDNLVGRLLARIGIENPHYLAWSGLGK